MIPMLKPLSIIVALVLIRLQWNFPAQGRQIAVLGPHVKTAFSVARGSIHENLQIWNILQHITVNVSAGAETNLNQDLLQSPLEGTALHCTRPSEIGPEPNALPTPGLVLHIEVEKSCKMEWQGAIVVFVLQSSIHFITKKFRYS